MAFPSIDEWERIPVNTTINACCDLWVMAGIEIKSHGSRGSIVGKIGDVEIGHAYVHYYRPSDQHTHKGTFMMPVPKGHDFKIEGFKAAGEVEYAALVMAVDAIAGQDLFKEV